VIIVKSSKGGVKKAIPMSNTLHGMLQRRVKIRHISGKVFSINRTNLKDAFRDALQKAGIEDLHFHDLRNTIATMLVHAGVDLYAIQKLLGHKTIRMTERYAHHYPESLRPSIDALDDCYNFATVTDFDTLANEPKR